MATLTTLIWITNALLLVWNLWSLLEDRYHGCNTIIMVFFFIVIASFGIGSAVYWDVYGSFPPMNDFLNILFGSSQSIQNQKEIAQESIRYLLISGLIALAIITIISLISRMQILRQGMNSVSHSKPANGVIKHLPRLLVDIVGFIASIFGIIAFYLDKLKK